MRRWPALGPFSPLPGADADRFGEMEWGERDRERKKWTGGGPRRQCHGFKRAGPQTPPNPSGTWTGWPDGHESCVAKWGGWLPGLACNGASFPRSPTYAWAWALGSNKRPQQVQFILLSKKISYSPQKNQVQFISQLLKKTILRWFDSNNG